MKFATASLLLPLTCAIALMATKETKSNKIEDWKDLCKPGKEAQLTYKYWYQLKPTTITVTPVEVVDGKGFFGRSGCRVAVNGKNRFFRWSIISSFDLKEAGGLKSTQTAPVTPTSTIPETCKSAQGEFKFKSASAEDCVFAIYSGETSGYSIGEFKTAAHGISKAKVIEAGRQFVSQNCAVGGICEFAETKSRTFVSVLREGEIDDGFFS